MHTTLTENKVFDKISFRENNIAKGVYEECAFNNCSFNSADLSGITFRACTFNTCDCSLVILNNTSLQDVNFVNAIPRQVTDKAQP